MDDVVVLETTNHLDDGIGLADVGEELVAEAGTFGCAFHQTGNVDELDGSGHSLLRLGHLGEFVETRVGHGDHADVGVDGAEGIVGGLRLAGAGDRIEQGGFSDVGKAYDSGFEHGGGRLL